MRGGGVLFRLPAKFRPGRAGALLLRLGAALIALTMAGCFPAAPEETIRLRVERGERLVEGRVPSGLTVREAVRALGVPTEPEDEFEPGLNRLVNEDTTVHITIIRSEETTADETIPFESQIIRSEAVAEGETYILQYGRNGAARVTKRKIYADDVFRSESVVGRVILEAPAPEILMVGVKSDLAPIRIPGKLIYLSNGNLWMMTETTGTRIPLYTGGDADGRILDLSENGRRLLFSREGRGEEINSLWMMDVENWTNEPISLRIENVVHFAEWLPGENLRVLYSTVTPTEEAPGWRANNDLQLRTVSDTGMILADDVAVPAQEADAAGSGLAADRWGTTYEVSADGRLVIAVHGDRIDRIDRLSGESAALIRVQPYGVSRSDWAWLPGVSLSDDDATLVFTYQGDIGGARRTFDPSDFNLGRYDFETGAAGPLISRTGLFSGPAISPRFSDQTYSLAYLTAVNPLQSETSRYRIAVADLDGTNARVVYPSEGAIGVEPQRLAWAPSDNRSETWLAFLHDGNIWLVNPFTGIYNQITIDRTIDKIIWE